MNLTLVAVVAIALFFDFTNGFHDTANSIATSVSTRALSPRVAVLSAAVLNFAGAFVSVAVAATIAKGIVDQEAITLEVVMAGLVGAITWNLVTWWFGIPSSSSHALIGGVTATVLWEITRHVLVWYFSTLSQVGVVYGSLTTAIAVLLSVEVGAIVLLLGAQVIAEYERAKILERGRRGLRAGGARLAATRGADPARLTGREGDRAGAGPRARARRGRRAPQSCSARSPTSPSTGRGSHVLRWPSAKRDRDRGRCPQPPELDGTRGRRHFAGGVSLSGFFALLRSLNWSSGLSTDEIRPVATRA